MPFSEITTYPRVFPKKYQTLKIIHNEAILGGKKIVAYQQRAHVCYDDRKVSSNQWPELKPPKPRKSMPRQPSANSCFAWFQRLWQTVGRMASFLASNAKPRSDRRKKLGGRHPRDALRIAASSIGAEDRLSWHFSLSA